ncbi:UNKNOWN [Stylonychia lemnae]|uniref:Cyclic nucleotide-binding domain-containing protein n=1 Tax=Stylonychia lemnae TaxID=5949 RepID=A0A078AUE6_STYLE|nr:UNKNOWN [Stylonychia lemnae]|eukprot:CDW84852.1 UNKNOWN [Stylonychia lemnae]
MKHVSPSRLKLSEKRIEHIGDDASIQDKQIRFDFTNLQNINNTERKFGSIENLNLQIDDDKAEFDTVKTDFDKQKQTQYQNDYVLGLNTTEEQKMTNEQLEIDKKKRDLNRYIINPETLKLKIAQDQNYQQIFEPVNLNEIYKLEGNENKDDQSCESLERGFQIILRKITQKIPIKIRIKLKFKQFKILKNLRILQNILKTKVCQNFLEKISSIIQRPKKNKKLARNKENYRQKNNLKDVLQALIQHSCYAGIQLRSKMDYHQWSCRFRISCRYYYLLTIIPFDYILESESYNRLGRILRLGKFYRMVKLIRLLRIGKVVKYESLFQQFVHRLFQLTIGYERLLFLLIMFLTLCHIATCLQIFIAKLEENQKQSWIFKSNFEDFGDYELYITAFYYTVTTIVTVGYGDITAKTVSEKLVSICLMIIGVVSFSYASGILTNIINNQDSNSAELVQKIHTLQVIKQKYKIKPELIKKIKDWLKYYHQKTLFDVTAFMDDLPNGLKTKLAVEANHQLCDSIDFLKRQDQQFILWVFPLLKPFFVPQYDYIYKDGDEILEIYFLESGEAAFVLQKFIDDIYINIEQGNYFGDIDLIYDPRILERKRLKQTNISSSSHQSDYTKSIISEKYFKNKYFSQELEENPTPQRSQSSISKRKSSYPDLYQKSKQKKIYESANQNYQKKSYKENKNQITKNDHLNKDNNTADLGERVDKIEILVKDLLSNVGKVYNAIIEIRDKAV